MAIQQVTRIQSTDPVLNRIQDQLAKVNPALANPLLDGNLVTAAVGTSPVAINHKLSRNFVGWILVDVDASVTVWRVNYNNRGQTLNLQASGACTVSVYVF